MKNRSMFTGIMLTGIGLLLLLSNLGWLSGVWFLYALSLGFLTAYFVYSRSLGFIIPGMLVGALASFAHLSERIAGLSAGFFFFFFSLAFFAVYFIHTMHLNTSDRGERIWPVFPGTALLAVGVLVYSVDNNFFGILPFRYLNYAVPLVLIAVGLRIVLSGSRKGNAGEK
jgi:hypothetical protein